MFSHGLDGATFYLDTRTHPLPPFAQSHAVAPIVLYAGRLPTAAWLAILEFVPFIDQMTQFARVSRDLNAGTLFATYIQSIAPNNISHGGDLFRFHRTHNEHQTSRLVVIGDISTEFFSEQKYQK